MTTERHPLDFDALQRGDSIPVERVERAVEMPRTHPSYRFGQMRLAKSVAQHFRDVRGDRVKVRCCKDGLQILTLAEQADYVPPMSRSGLRRHTEAYLLGCSVPLKSLDDERRQRLERFLYVTAFRIQQLRKPPPPLLTDQE